MKRWRYTPAADLDKTMVERLRTFPARARHAGLWLALARRAHHPRLAPRPGIGSRSWARSICRAMRSFVLVANHSSHLDTVCLLAALPFRTAAPRVSGRGRRLFFPKRAAHLDRIGGRQCAAIFAQRPRAPQHDGLLAAARESRQRPHHFPGRDALARSAGIQEFKSGIGALVAGRDVHVLPCYLEGAFRGLAEGPPLAAPAQGAADHRAAAQLRRARRRQGELFPPSLPSCVDAVEQLRTNVMTSDRTHDDELGRH